MRKSGSRSSWALPPGAGGYRRRGWWRSGCGRSRVVCRLRWTSPGLLQGLPESRHNLAAQLCRRRLGEGDDEELVQIHPSRSTRSRSRWISTKVLRTRLPPTPAARRPGRPPQRPVLWSTALPRVTLLSLSHGPTRRPPPRTASPSRNTGTGGSLCRCPPSKWQAAA